MSRNGYIAAGTPPPLPSGWPLMGGQEWPDHWGRWPWVVNGQLECVPPWEGKNLVDALRACLRFAMVDRRHLAGVVLERTLSLLAHPAATLENDRICLYFPGIPESEDDASIRRARCIESLSFILRFDHLELRDIQRLICAPTPERLAEANTIADVPSWLRPKTKANAVLNETEKNIAEQIKKNPGVLGKKLAEICHQSPDHIRRIMGKTGRLHALGFRQKPGLKGYYPPSS